MNTKTHAICPICHSDHTARSRCDCQKVEVKVDQIPKHQRDIMARTVLNATAKAFEDPAVRADYERWQAERQKATT